MCGPPGVGERAASPLPTRMRGMTALSSTLVDWRGVEMVFLDLDGTLLDLRFDNDFWLRRVPEAWARERGVSAEAARDALFPRMRALRGTLDWYCVEFWSRELGLDIVAMKRSLRHRVQVRPGVEPFLRRLAELGLPRVLLTNAHEKTLDIKLEKTGIGSLLDQVISSHSLGVPKEDARFWPRLAERMAFSPERTLFVDDSLPVLQAARRFGIGQLLCVAQPDSSLQPSPAPGFHALGGFEEIMPGPRR